MIDEMFYLGPHLRLVSEDIGLHFEVRAASVGYRRGPVVWRKLGVGFTREEMHELMDAGKRFLLDTDPVSEAGQ